MGHRQKNLKETWVLFLILLVGLGFRLSYLAHLLPVCRADEAVFGLMTKHLLEGKSLPIYLYEAHYAGALICYLAAVPFLLFGSSIIALKLTTYLFSLATILLVYFLARSLWDRKVAFLSALFLALPPFLITWTGQYAGGGYPETLFFGSASLFFTHRFLSRDKTPAQEIRTMALLGFLNGLGTWILFSMIPYTLTVWTLALFKKERHSLGKLFVAFFLFYAVGVSPIVIYNCQNSFATFTRLGANVMEIERADLSGKGAGGIAGLGVSKMAAKMFHLPEAVFQVILNIWRMARIEGASGGWVKGLNLFLAGMFCFQMITLFRPGRDPSTQKAKRLFSVLIFWMVLFLAMTNLTKARYVSFMYPAISISLAWALSRGPCRPAALKIFFIILFLFANLVNYVIAMRTPEAEDQFGNLVGFIESKGLRYGYSDYATAYPIAFLTREKVIVSPMAGPLNVERIPSYTERVNREKEVFFVFLKETEASKRFESSLKERGVFFQRRDISESGTLSHSVYYGFSRRVTPQELPLIRLLPN